MDLKETAQQWLKSVAAKHLGKNIRSYKWISYLGVIAHNAFGGICFPSPKEGKVVDSNHQFTMVKTGLAEFVIVTTALLSSPVNIGDKIGLCFYKLKRFDGTDADGRQDTTGPMLLTGAKSYFPVKWPDRYLGIDEKFSDRYTEIQNPYLQDLINQMEAIPVDGGMRRVVNILIDANATQLVFNDPVEERSMEDRPAINVHVSTAKHVGSVSIIYNRVPDTYTIELTPDNGSKKLILEDLYFDQLGQTLIDGIDDGSWKTARVTVLKPATKKQVATATT